MSNYQGGLKCAYKQFLLDLKSDKDFLRFKKTTHTKRQSYGVVVVGGNKFLIETTFSRLKLQP